MKKILPVFSTLVVSAGVVGAFCMGQVAATSNVDVDIDYCSNVSNYMDLKVCLENGGVTTLGSDVLMYDSIDVSSNATLNLNGHTVSSFYNFGSPHDYLFGVKRGGNLTINGEGLIDGGAAFQTTAVKLTVKGEAATGEAAKLTINGGTIKARDFAVSGNGTRHNTEVVINGGQLISTGTDGAGLFQPQVGTVTINGGAISGCTGVEVRSGDLTINDGVFTGTCTTFSTSPSGNGNTIFGAGLGVSQHTTGNPINVKVKGGEFVGTKAFYEANIQGMPPEAISQIALAISGGTFLGPVYSEDVTNFVTGGYFSEKPTNIPEGYEAVLVDGLWVVRKVVTPTPVTPTQPNKVNAPDTGTGAESSVSMGNPFVLIGTAFMSTIAIIAMTYRRKKSPLQTCQKHIK